MDELLRDAENNLALAGIWWRRVGNHQSWKSAKSWQRMSPRQRAEAIRMMRAEGLLPPIPKEERVK